MATKKPRMDIRHWRRLAKELKWDVDELKRQIEFYENEDIESTAEKDAEIESLREVIRNMSGTQREVLQYKTLADCAMELVRHREKQLADAMNLLKTKEHSVRQRRKIEKRRKGN